MKRKYQKNPQNYQKDPQNMQQDQIGQQGQQSHTSKKIRLQAKQKVYIEEKFSPFPIEEKGHINFSVIPDTCLGGKEHKGDRVEDLEKELTPEYYKFKSDHALIRVEFKDFVIYSWNLLNGDDATIIPYTFGPFNYLKSKEFPKGFDFPLYNNDTKKFANDFKENNASRTQNLLDIVDRVKQDEKNPVILFFQEVGPTMLDVIQKHYQDYYHIFHDNDEAEVAWDAGPKRAVVKNECRVTLIPKIIEKEDIVQHSIPMGHFEIKKLIYIKPQLLISFVIDGKKFCLINCHWYWLSLFKDVTNFLEQVELYLKEEKIKNVIFVGDFNRPLHSIKESDRTFEAEVSKIQEKLEQIQSQQQKINQIQTISPYNKELKAYRFKFLQDRIVEYLTDNNYQILNQTEQYTFITASLGGSDCVDQCIYRVEKPVSEGEYIEFASVKDDDDDDSAFSYVGGKDQVEQSYKEYFQKYGKLMQPQDVQQTNMQQQNTQQGNTQQGNMQQQNTKQT